MLDDSQSHVNLSQISYSASNKTFDNVGTVRQMKRELLDQHSTNVQALDMMPATQAQLLALNSIDGKRSAKKQLPQLS